MDIDEEFDGPPILVYNFFGGGKSGCCKIFPIRIFQLGNRVTTWFSPLNSGRGNIRLTLGSPPWRLSERGNPVATWYSPYGFLGWQLGGHPILLFQNFKWETCVTSWFSPFKYFKLRIGWFPNYPPLIFGWGPSIFSRGDHRMATQFSPLNF
jgi:hypothetical protein